MNDDNNNEPVRTESPELAAPVDFPKPRCCRSPSSV